MKIAFLLFTCMSIAQDQNKKNDTAKLKHDSVDQTKPTLKDFSPLSLVKDEDIVSTEHFLSKDPLDKNKVKVCLYLDGATVNATLQNNEVYSNADKNFAIRGLSDSIDKKSILIKPPNTISLLGYKMRQDNSSKSPFLELSVKNLDETTDKDHWRIQYVVKNVLWQASHIIELSSNMEYASFVTLILVKNESGIDFKQAQIQFFDGNLPSDDLSTDQENGVTKPCVTSSVIYQYDDYVDIIPGQDKTILWVNAKKIAITSRNGLFVGGPFLKKMTAPAYPRIENWINFPNTENVGLGKHLPSGKVAIYHNRDGFISLTGFSNVNQVKAGSDIAVRMPLFLQNYDSDGVKTGEEYSPLDVQLIQESYRQLTPTVSAAEYTLTLKNLKNIPVSVTITIDSNSTMVYSVDRASINTEKNKNGETCWNIDIPPNGNRELRYKLTVRYLT
jgi:hypothetical protein